MRILVLLSCLSISWVALAGVQYQADFDDPVKEEAYVNLINELRCLVCQNQTIADSNADLAKDLRRQVHEMLKEGQSVQEITDFMTERYGDFVLYNPPLKAKTSVLWVGPFIFLVIGILILFYMARRKKADNEKILEIELAKKKKIKSILNEGENE